MISEEDSLLGYVNEMEKYVKGRSYYINPVDIDKVLLTDYLNNKRQKMIRAHSSSNRRRREEKYVEKLNILTGICFG